jgi:Ca2+-binding EF-hand superfamily protein
MKHVAILTAVALGSAAVIAVAAPEGREARGAMQDRIKQADTNGDGMLNRAEAAALPRILKHFDEIDTNHDNQISADELRAFHEKMRAGHEKQRGEHWKKLDTNGDGKISKDEAKAAPRLAERFDQIDANKDGFITPDEMKAAHEKMRSAK